MRSVASASTWTPSTLWWPLISLRPPATERGHVLSVWFTESSWYSYPKNQNCNLKFTYRDENFRLVWSIRYQPYPSSRKNNPQKSNNSYMSQIIYVCVYTYASFASKASRRLERPREILFSYLGKLQISFSRNYVQQARKSDHAKMKWKSTDTHNRGSLLNRKPTQCSTRRPQNDRSWKNTIFSSSESEPAQPYVIMPHR